jgi:sugar O-acyltransferase (sialic acid O-acetyltransferase NeuD family)
VLKRGPAVTKKKLVIVGDSVFAQVAYEYFSYDSIYEVVAFSVEAAFIRTEHLFGLPVIAFEQLETRYLPKEHYFYVAVIFSQANRLRTRLYHEAKAKGFNPASYISSDANIQEKSLIGEHCFICEQTVVQSAATIESNVVLWSGNFIGHHTLVRRNCFTLPHVVISENAEIGENCIIGPNATILRNVSVANDTFIEAGTIVSASD